MGCGPSTQSHKSKNHRSGNKSRGDRSSTTNSEKLHNVAPTSDYPSTSGSATHDDDLSSISSEDLPERPSGNPLVASQSQNRSSNNLESLRTASEAPSIEDEFFEYDGVKFSKSSEWQKKMKIAGRKPVKIPTGGTQNPDGSTTKDNFEWGDFKVSKIDEIDDLPEQPAGADRRESSVLQHRVPFSGIRKFEVTNLLGHASRVKCIAIAPSEREYVSCSNEDASVTLFNLKNGKEMGIFTGHQDTVINAAFSSDGKYLATTSRDHSMILWDVVTTKQVLTFDHSKVVICCCFSKDSKYIATGCQDKSCRLWETKRGRECLIFSQHEGIIISMSYSPDNLNIVSASADKTLRVWSTATGKTKHLLQGHSGIVLSCQYTGDGKKIISNDEKLLKVWNADDGTCCLTLAVDKVNANLKGTQSLSKKLTWTLSCVAPGDFTDYLFVACNNRFVYLLDINSGEEVASVFCKAPVYCLTPGFQNLAAFGDSFGNVYVVRIE